MALTVSNVRIKSVANVKMVTADITGDSSHASNGEDLAKATLGLTDVHFAITSPSSGYTAWWDHANGKFQVYQSAALASHTHDLKIIGSQASAGTDAVSAKTLTLGKEAATDITIAGANSATLGGVVAGGSAAAASLSAATGVDLSTVTFQLLAFGV